jgi:hypothetical protein
MLKKILFGLTAIVAAFLLAGCFQVRVAIDVQPDGQATSKVDLVFSRAYASQEGAIAYTLMLLAFPELQTQYETLGPSAEEVTGIGEAIVYTFVAKAPFDIKSNRFVSFLKNEESGNYVLRVHLPKMLEKASESNPRRLSLSVKLPGEIAMANTIYFRENEAIWILNEADFTEDLDLIAITKALVGPTICEIPQQPQPASSLINLGRTYGIVHPIP